VRCHSHSPPNASRFFVFVFGLRQLAAAIVKDLSLLTDNAPATAVGNAHEPRPVPVRISVTVLPSLLAVALSTETLLGRE
jgi:hypothetical protein